MTKRSRGLQLLLVCVVLSCVLVLLGMAGFHSTYSRATVTARAVAPSSLYLGFGSRAGQLASSGSTSSRSSSGSSSSGDSSSSSSSSSGGGQAVELKNVLTSMQQQLEALRSALPSTIQQELKNFYASHSEASETAREQQEHKQQQQQQGNVPLAPLKRSEGTEPVAAAAAAPTVAAPAASQPQQHNLLAAAQPAKPPALPHIVHHVGKARSACDKTSAAAAAATAPIKLELSDKLVAPLVVVAYNRVHYLARSLMTVLRHWHNDPANAQRFPLYVSVDDGEASTSAFAAALNFGANVQVIHNVRDATRCKPKDGYCNLSVHFHMLLELFFKCLSAPRVLFLEEDLDVAPDFFSYFAAMAPLLESDANNTMCVSAFNDHGQARHATNSSALYRTDIFPGLGWMISAGFAAEITDGWPDFYWDEYMRKPQVRQGRTCVFPEVSRTYTFGKKGTSGGGYHDTNLKPIRLNQDSIDWHKQDLSHIEGPAFATQLKAQVAAAQPVDRATTDVRQLCVVNRPDHDERGDLLMPYTSVQDFAALAAQLSPMPTDCKGGPAKPGYPLVPRASFQGIVSVRCRGRRLFLAPQPGSAAEVKPWSEVSALYAQDKQ